MEKRLEVKASNGLLNNQPKIRTLLRFRYAEKIGD